MATGDVILMREAINNAIEAIEDIRKRMSFTDRELTDIQDELVVALELSRRDRWKNVRAKPSAKRSIRDLSEDEINMVKYLSSEGVPNRDIGHRFGFDGGRVSDLLGSKEVV